MIFLNKHILLLAYLEEENFVLVFLPMFKFKEKSYFDESGRISLPIRIAFWSWNKKSKQKVLKND